MTQPDAENPQPADESEPAPPMIVPGTYPSAVKPTEEPAKLPAPDDGPAFVSETKATVAMTAHRPPLSRRRKIIFSLVAVLVFFFVAELIARAVVPMTNISERFAQAEKITIHIGRGLASSAFENDGERFWRLRPGVVLERPTFDEDYARPLWWGVISNSLGFRNGEFDRKKQPGIRRVLCIGDSTTFGAGVSMRDAWPNRMQNQLNRLAEGTHKSQYDVINAGVPGYTSYQGLLYLTSLLKDIEPDAVVATFGNNDGWPWDGRSDAEHATAAGDGNDRPSILLRSRLAQLIVSAVSKSPEEQAAQIKSDWAERVVSNEIEAHADFKPRVSVTEYERNLRSMAKLCSAHGVPLVLVVWPWRQETANQGRPRAAYQDTTRRVARELKLRCVDLSRIFFKRRRTTRDMYLDGVHLNEDGNQLVMESICPILWKHCLQRR